MIRAFAIGVAVGTIRIWIAVFQISGLLSFSAAFGPAFWISFMLHALIAELWLRTRPLPPEMTAEVQEVTMAR
jgi:predicted membrane metal-binding protein